MLYINTVPYNFWFRSYQILEQKQFFSCFFVEQGEVQYFIGVQLDGSQHVEPLHNRIAENTAKEGEQLVWFLSIQLLYSFNFLT